MPNSLWTPDGMVPLAEKGVIPITRREIIMLSEMHEFAFNNELAGLICKRCDHEVRGHNNDSAKVLTVACQCREWRFDGR